MILEGVAGIVEGLNPKLIRSKLESYTQGRSPEEGKNAEKAVKGTDAPVRAEA